MDIKTAMQNRHAVRSYVDRKIGSQTMSELEEAEDCNREGGLHIQVITNEPDAFKGILAHYGKFKGVQNYIALVGKKTEKFDEKIGYFGERMALRAQMLSLNTCWVAATYSKRAAKKAIRIGPCEQLGCVIALGYGQTQGTPHKSKPMSQLYKTNSSVPQWFKEGMQAAMLAPTAMNQQKFLFELDGDTVTAKSLGGLYSNVDLGIVKYHFEVGSGKKL